MSESDADNRDAPSKAMMIMLAPDGYYTYLNIPKVPVQNSSGSVGSKESGEDPLLQIDLDLVKKNFRKLSIRHHPDKPGGDSDTFRTLKRAQTVLSNPKLRQQYDILGLDLDDDDVEQNSSAGINDEDAGAEPQTTSQGIIQDIASAALTTVLQLGVRTALLGTISLIIARYRLTLFPTLAFLAFVAYKVRSGPTVDHSLELMSPFVIGIGMIIMYQASSGSWSSISEDGTKKIHWLLYWLGESITIFMFTYNSMEVKPSMSSPIYLGAIGLFGILAALWFRGKFWNYAIVIGLEIFLAIFIALAFPVFEMILEAILNDKLKKVGDKIRAQHKCMERYYKQQSND
ncbi:unnamed protein product [Pseudo-nitzschia multistriata]|uniref:J domain-containing protein n=1 Tax=Pseudo-nitzschia multistriata TaxID=183589 RepID=A0A448YZA6_9STRA|nr:unnamed protein product [Pseudo-nitzschia multistriata]